MNPDDNSDWPSLCVSKAAANGAVPARAADVLATQLSGTAQQRPLRLSELGDLAAQLIAAIEPLSPGDAA